MEDFADLRRRFWENNPRPPFGEIADADQPLGLKDFDDAAQMFIARGQERLKFPRRQFVRREVAPRRLKECQRAIVGNEVLLEEFFSLPESNGEQSPKSPAADLRTPAGEPFNRSLRMLARRFFNYRADVHPIAHGSDLSERHTGLHHTKWAGIHAHEHHALAAIAKSAQVSFMRRPSVAQGVVNRSNWWSEIQIIDRGTE